MTTRTGPNSFLSKLQLILLNYPPIDRLNFISHQWQKGEWSELIQPSYTYKIAGYFWTTYMKIRFCLGAVMNLSVIGVLNGIDFTWRDSRCFTNVRVGHRLAVNEDFHSHRKTVGGRPCRHGTSEQPLTHLITEPHHRCPSDNQVEGDWNNLADLKQCQWEDHVSRFLEYVPYRPRHLRYSMLRGMSPTWRPMTQSTVRHTQ